MRCLSLSVCFFVCYSGATPAFLLSLFFVAILHFYPFINILCIVQGLSLPFPGPYAPFLLFQFSKIPFHDWEKTPNFDPTKVSVNCPRWVNYKGSLLTEAQEMAENAHITQEFVSSVITEAFADASFLAFRDPSCFRAGELHCHIDQWDKLFQYSDDNFSEVQDWIHNYVRVDKFFTHKKGAIRGLIIIAIGRLLAFLLITFLVRLLPSLFLILLSGD